MPTGWDFNGIPSNVLRRNIPVQFNKNRVCIFSWIQFLTKLSMLVNRKIVPSDYLIIAKSRGMTETYFSHTTFWKLLYCRISSKNWKMISLGIILKSTGKHRNTNSGTENRISFFTHGEAHAARGGAPLSVTPTYQMRPHPATPLIECPQVPQLQRPPHTNRHEPAPAPVPGVRPDPRTGRQDAPGAGRPVVPGLPRVC